MGAPLSQHFNFQVCIYNIMELRKLKLKEQYRSDEDDIISDFLIPCLNNCIEYDRAVEHVTLRGSNYIIIRIPQFHTKCKNEIDFRTSIWD